jgi:hypothetical protein
MELEDVLADHDSEDEIDNDITDLEDMMVRCDNLSNLEYLQASTFTYTNC